MTYAFHGHDLSPSDNRPGWWYCAGLRRHLRWNETARAEIRYAALPLGHAELYLVDRATGDERLVRHYDERAADDLLFRDADHELDELDHPALLGLA